MCPRQVHPSYEGLLVGLSLKGPGQEGRWDCMGEGDAVPIGEGRRFLVAVLFFLMKTKEAKEKCKKNHSSTFPNYAVLNNSLLF